ncbi:MAG TPA: fumarylacetoacetate hydrolase family protein [Actinocrinis sp.]|nr:fumarylacetoacetate hydrolase family protein [Actinocrinis sp.]
MRLLRVGRPGSEIPAVLLEDGSLRDASGVTPDYGPGFFAAGGPAALEAAVRSGGLPPLAEPDRIGAPLAGTGKIVCIARNYPAHAAEVKAALPTEPVVVLKAANTLIGPNDDVLIPPGSTKTDWEAELGVVIGRTARRLGGPADADAAIAGYVLCNDVSEREYQQLGVPGAQWDKGKSCDTFFPCGPWLVTPDEIADPQRLGIRLWVNGELRQDASTADMLFGVRHLIWYLSRYMTLEPGDIVSTGTPAGTGMGLKPPVYLAPGDTMRLTIDGLGEARQTCRSIDTLEDS